VAITTAGGSPRLSSQLSNSEKDPERARQRTLDEERDPALLEGHAITSFFRRREKKDPKAIATQTSVYDDPIQAQFFQPHPRYENLHRFDPSLTWTWEEETVIGFLYSALVKELVANK
jgi:hypothetical protein